MPNLSPGRDVLFLFAALRRAEEAHVVNLFILDRRHRAHHRQQVGILLLVFVDALGFHPDFSEPARPGRVEGSLAEEEAATGGRGQTLAQRQRSRRRSRPSHGTPDEGPGDLPEGQPALGVLQGERLEHRVRLRNALAAHRRQVGVGISPRQQEYPRLLDVHGVLVGQRPGKRHRHAAVDALARDRYPNGLEVRNLEGHDLVDLLGDPGPNGKVYVTRVAALHVTLLGRHRQQRLPGQRLGVDPERDLHAPGVGQHDLLVDRLVESLPAEIDGRGVQFVLDEVSVGGELHVVRGTAFHLADGDGTNLGVRLGKVRYLHAFLLARLEVAADGEHVENLLGICVSKRGGNLGPPRLYPLPLVQPILHHLIHHRRFVFVHLAVVVVGFKHPLEPGGNGTGVSHGDVLALRGVVEHRAKVDERVAHVEVGKRNLRAEVDGIDVRVIVVAHEQLVANLVGLAVAAVVRVEGDPDRRRLVGFQFPVRFGLYVKRGVHLYSEPQGNRRDVAHGDGLFLDLVGEIRIVRKLEREGVLGEVHQRDGDGGGGVNRHHLLRLPVRPSGVFTHQSLPDVALELGKAREREHHRGLGPHGDLLRGHREGDAELAVGWERFLLLLLDADLLQVALTRILLRRLFLDRLLDLLLGGDVAPHQLLQLTRVVGHHDFPAERSILELRAKVDGAGSVEVGARGQAPDPLGAERDHERRALDDHDVELILVNHELVHVNSHRERVLLAGLQGFLPGVHEKGAIRVLHKGSDIRGDQRLVRHVNHPRLVPQHGRLAPFDLGNPDGVGVVRFLREPQRGSP